MCILIKIEEALLLQYTITYPVGNKACKAALKCIFTKHYGTRCKQRC